MKPVADRVAEILYNMGNMHSHVDIEERNGGFMLIRTYEIADDLLREYGVPGEKEILWTRTLADMHRAIIEKGGDIEGP